LGAGEATGGRPILRSERIWMRPLEASDLPLLREWLNDADVAETMSDIRPWSEGQGERWLTENEAQQGKTAWRFVICLRESDLPIGIASLDEVNLVQGHGELGLLIGDRSRWDQGYGTEATRLTLDLGFGELRLERVFLYVMANNARGRHAYEKAGFRHEGTLRHMHYRHGRFLDWELMSILRDEWLAQERPRSWESS
jgi:RimJ/RimL family protein N-acetyltransferase